MHTISRSRWAAVGAAVAVTLGAGGIGITHATTDSGDGTVAAYIPVEPCRLADTRPGGIAADSFQDFDGWGSTGGCNLPNGTSGLSLNVTAVDATQQTNLRFYPQGTDIPDTANLNPSPGAPATPNAVNVSLNDANGKFSVYNRFGNVSVIIDVMGYYDDHTHDSRYYTEDEADAALGAKADADAVYTKDEADAAHDSKADADDVYTKQQVRDLFIDRQLFLGAFLGSGDKVGTGPFTVTRSSAGVYNVDFTGLAALTIPYPSTGPVVVATPHTSCANSTAVAGWVSFGGGTYLNSVRVRILSYDNTGAAADCRINFMLQFASPDTPEAFPADARLGKASTLECITTFDEERACTGR